MHHHVAIDDRGTIARLYRFINGTALGLVACGGGALCAAHVGLYKALIECGFEFDIIGGTSAGAAMGAAFAMGKHPDDIDRGTHDIFVTNRAMQRYTWPRYSLLDHRHYDTQLAAISPAPTSRICGSRTSRYPPTCRATSCTATIAAICSTPSAPRAPFRCCCRPFTPRRRDAGRRLPARQRADPHHA